MRVYKCDICGTTKETMEEFNIPMYSWKNQEYINGIKIEEGIYPVVVNLCPACQERIADYIRSIVKVV